MNQKKSGSTIIKTVILNTVLVICTVAIVICGIKIVRSLNDYSVAEEKNEQISSGMADLIANLNQTSAPSAGQNTGPNGTSKPDRELREEYREIQEYLTGLKKQYPDLYAWIYIEFDEEHVINLPIMQADDNNYYIDHAYDGTKSSSGAVFADYRNTDRKIDLNQNLVLYGHNMNNTSMFALVSSRYKQRTNFDSIPITIYSLEGKYTFNVFSVYNGRAGENYDTVAFGRNNLKDFCEEMQMRSLFSKQLDFSNHETVLTLVTCTNYASDGRVIVHGVLDGYESFYE